MTTSVAGLPVSAELSNDFKETVRLQTDIVSLIGESIQLQPRHGGREYAGLCPFHDDHNPSFHVYPDRQTYRCWVCNEGGDCFSFVMKHDHVEFRDALEVLARRAGIPIPARKAQGGSGPDKSNLLEVLSWAEGVFHQTLLRSPAAEPARRYLEQRGFTQQTIARFRLGYHPNDWEWIQKEARNRFSPSQLAAVCLVKQQEGGARYSDYFTDRVLFPIHNERGQPVGFGGRILPGQSDDFGKYFNSPESSVFHKSRLVYALSHARQGLRESGTAVVTEGYTDCIAAHQAGLANVVATLGTAMTVEQVTTLKRFAQKVVLVYDGDEAGQRAAERAVVRFLAQDVDLRVLTLPAGEDPADFIAHHGVETLASMIDAAPEAFDFVFQTLRQRHGIETVDGRTRILQSILGLLAVVPRLARNVREDLLLHRTAERLGLPEKVVREQYMAARGTTSAPSSRSLPHAGPDEPTAFHEHTQRLVTGRLTRDDRMECELLEALISVPALTPFAAQELDADDFRNPALGHIVRRLFQLSRNRAGFDFAKLLAQLDDQPGIKSVAVRLDELARSKQTGEKLRKEQLESSECPPLLRRSIDALIWRREQDSHEQTSLKLSQAVRGAASWAEETEEELLRQFARFHQKRATQRPTGT